MHKIVLFGAGGHARVLIDAIQSTAQHKVCAALDDDSNKWGTKLFHVPIVGNDSHINDLLTQGVDSFAVAIGSVSQIQLRRNLFERACAAGLEPCSVLHSSSIYSRYASLGKGVQLLAQSVVNPGAELGEGVIINTGAIVEHDCLIGTHTHLAPRACLAGGVQVGSGSHIGMGAVVKENITIGKDVIIGAGAVVLNDVPDRSIAVGIPARPISRKEAA